MEKVKSPSIAKYRLMPGSPAMYPTEYRWMRNETTVTTTSIIRATASSLRCKSTGNDPIRNQAVSIKIFSADRNNEMLIIAEVRISAEAVMFTTHEYRSGIIKLSIKETNGMMSANPNTISDVERFCNV
jgi:hypothetical protein